VIEQSANIVHKQGIQCLRDLLLVGKVKSAIEWDPGQLLAYDMVQRSVASSPNALEMHGAYFDHGASLLTLEDAVTSTAGHASHVQELGAVDHMIVWLNVSIMAVQVVESDDLPSLRATQMPLASIWKHIHPSSSQRVAVTRGFIPLGAI